MKLKVELLTVSVPETFLADVARVSTGRENFGARDRDADADVKLLTALYREGHWSIFEFLNAIFLVDAPCYVRDQLIRYRCASYNARSLRRCEPLEIENPETESEKFYNDVALKRYREARGAGLKKEDARTCLPSCAPTRWVVNYNARELFHVFDQRLDERAQVETHAIVRQMLEAFESRCPLLGRLWREERIEIKRGER